MTDVPDVINVPFVHNVIIVHYVPDVPNVLIVLIVLDVPLVLNVLDVFKDIPKFGFSFPL